MINKLSARSILTLTRKARYGDGGGLFLAIDGGTRKWVFIYRDRQTSRKREMGLGPAPGPDKHGVSLADARAKAAEARKMLWDGKDPLTEKRAARAAAATETFGTFADTYVANVSGGFKSEIHKGQRKLSIESHAASLRPMRLDAITTEDILRVLEPIWEKTPETGKRTQGRIERILDAARAKGLRTGENPARWKGHLKELLGKRKGPKAHHAALAYTDMPAFMIDLRKSKSVSALALEFTVLNASRTGETLGATWAEIDLEQKLWTIPAARMKAAREHRVPLSERAIAILESVRTPKMGLSGFVFPGARKGKPLSNMAMLKHLCGVRDGVTVHGMRSAFSDWVGDCTSFSEETREFCLAHVKGDKAEAAYRRGDALAKRRKLLKAWCRFLNGESSNAASLVEAA
jgi:integrase